jgi:glucose/arabinose dehydrogenase
MSATGTLRAPLFALVAIALGLGAQACGSSKGSGGASASSSGSATTARTSVTSTTVASPLPKASNGAPVRVIGRGVPTPTSIAIGSGTVFVGAAGTEEGTKESGGLFALTNGQAKRMPGAPAVVFGLAYHREALYIAAGPEILRWSGWNGASFAKRQALYHAPRGFDGFNGIAFGPDGRIYAGVTLNSKDDHLRSTARFGQSVVSLSPNGGPLKLLARGLREPFQLTFVPGNPNPYVSVLGQDNLGKTEPPDYIVVARPGQDYGFPTCNWSKPSACARYARPLVLLPAHASPMGIGAIGQTLYVALFGGVGHGPEVASVPATGGAVKPVLTGFVEPVVALAANDGSLYAGDLSGTIYSVRAAASAVVNSSS